MQKVFVTGAAGFIGSTLVDYLLDQGCSVVGYDNFITGQREFLQKASSNGEFQLVQGDHLDSELLAHSMKECDTVFHLSANADVRFGLEHPMKDLQQNALATLHVLEAMRHNGLKRILFSSTGSIYGEAEVFPTPEKAPFPIQTSLYGASKLAAEGLISAYCEGFGFEGYIFRFVSILGERYTHGHVFDFVRQLQKNPKRLTILGNGKQRKSYLYVQDCIRAMHQVVQQGLAQKSKHRVAMFNLGSSDYCEVRDSVGWICSQLGLDPQLEFTGGDRGWVGDNPFIFLDTQKIRETGWKPLLTIEQGIRKTVDWLTQNPWVFERRF